mgnify:FL=1
MAWLSEHKPKAKRFAAGAYLCFEFEYPALTRTKLIVSRKPKISKQIFFCARQIRVFMKVKQISRYFIQTPYRSLESQKFNNFMLCGRNRVP